MINVYFAQTAHHLDLVVLAGLLGILGLDIWSRRGK